MYGCGHNYLKGNNYYNYILGLTTSRVYNEVINIQ